MCIIVGIDFPGGSGGFNINLWINDKGHPVYRAFYVNRDKTNREFIEVLIEIYETLYPHNFHKFSC